MQRVAASDREARPSLLSSPDKVQSVHLPIKEVVSRISTSTTVLVRSDVPVLSHHPSLYFVYSCPTRSIHHPVFFLFFPFLASARLSNYRQVSYSNQSPRPTPSDPHPPRDPNSRHTRINTSHNPIVHCHPKVPSLAPRGHMNVKREMGESPLEEATVP